MKDSFFDLGGYSLLITRIVADINKALNAQMSIPTFFQNPTIERLARVIEEWKHVPGQQVALWRAGHNGPPIYFVGAGLVEHRVAHLIGGDRAIYAIDIRIPTTWRHAITVKNRAALPTVEQLGTHYGKLLHEHSRIFALCDCRVSFPRQDSVRISARVTKSRRQCRVRSSN